MHSTDNLFQILTKFIIKRGLCSQIERHKGAMLDLKLHYQYKRQSCVLETGQTELDIN